MSCFELTEAAAGDLDSIDDYTIARFGLDQAISNRQEFVGAFEMLAQNPNVGHVREDLTPGGRDYRYWVVLRRFMIVYEKISGGVRLIRVLDGSRDLPEILSSEAS